MFFKKRKEEFNIEDIIPDHDKQDLPGSKKENWDELDLESLQPPRKEESNEVPQIPPISDFFSTISEQSTPPKTEPLFPKREESELLPPPSSQQSQPRGEISRVDVELILSKLENIDHRLRWIEDQLRRRGTI
jgi:hypothetical protein